MGSKIKLDWRKTLQLADTFYLLSVALPESAVDMGDIKLVSDTSNLCGTTACHAGWFEFIFNSNVSGYGYSKGAKQMAKFLNFTCEEALENYLENNHRIWGNRFGEDVFSSKKAFLTKKQMKDIQKGKLKYYDIEITLETIANHWYGVTERLLKLESKK
jgi:hypothetical protein